jgi:hypothetical protein
MKTLVRAVITGFGISVGAALYKKLAKQLGLEDEKNAKEKDPATTPAASVADSPLQTH